MTQIIMIILNNIQHSIQHFLHMDFKNEVLLSVGSAITVSSVVSHKNELYQELMIRDINTLAIGLFTGILTFFVTMWLRKFYPKKKDE